MTTERSRRVMYEKSTKEISFAELTFHELQRTNTSSEVAIELEASIIPGYQEGAIDF